MAMNVKEAAVSERLRSATRKFYSLRWNVWPNLPSTEDRRAMCGDSSRGERQLCSTTQTDFQIWSILQNGQMSPLKSEGAEPYKTVENCKDW
jgi:hypothetical protein